MEIELRWGRGGNVARQGGAKVMPCPAPFMPAPFRPVVPTSLPVCCQGRETELGLSVAREELGGCVGSGSCFKEQDQKSLESSAQVNPFPGG